MKSSTAREAILRFFAEPPEYATEDLGILVRVRGRDYFLEAARIVEITGTLAVSRLPGTRGRGVSFWRGKAPEVIGEAFESAGGFVLVRGGHGNYFLASDTPPRGAARRDLDRDLESYPEEA